MKVIKSIKVFQCVQRTAFCLQAVNYSVTHLTSFLTVTPTFGLELFSNLTSFTSCRPSLSDHLSQTISGHEKKVVCLHKTIANRNLRSSFVLRSKYWPTASRLLADDFLWTVIEVFVRATEAQSSCLIWFNFVELRDCETGVFKK